MKVVITGDSLNIILGQKLVSTEPVGVLTTKFNVWKKIDNKLDLLLSYRLKNYILREVKNEYKMDSKKKSIL